VAAIVDITVRTLVVQAGIGGTYLEVIAFGVGITASGDLRVPAGKILTDINRTGITVIAMHVLGAAVGNVVMLAGIVYA